MGTTNTQTNTQVTIPALSKSTSHSTGQGTGGRLGGRRGLIIAAVVATAATALALGQHWLAVANLAPLLFILPCAAMMFMCMKGNHGQQTNTSPTSTPGGTPSVADTRN